MTIDEMLDKVAQNLNIPSEKPVLQEKPKTPDTVSVVSKEAAQKHECSCSDKRGHCKSSAVGEKCSCGGDCKHSHKDNKPLEGYRKHNMLDLTVAKLIAEGVERAAKAIGIKVVISIDNEGANLILLHAMDDSYIASISAAQEKAYTAVSLKMPTHTALEESRGGVLDGFTNGNGILMLGGGYPLDKNGVIFGGIGVSGGTKEQDTLLAQVGAELFRAFTG